ncbi:MAG: hypothetical protein ABUS79_00280 [Pseudomonadota bacterium]
MLDNTLVVYWSECSIGVDHSIPDIPVALFGGKSLGLQQGSFIKYTGRTFADLWVETFKRFGYNKCMARRSGTRALLRVFTREKILEYSLPPAAKA